MRIQSIAERLQKIVTLSEINLYHLDHAFGLIEEFVLLADEKKFSKEGEGELYKLAQQEDFMAPVIWESAESELVGLIKVSDESYYLTSMLRADKLVKLLIFLEVADDIIFDRNIQQKDIMVRQDVRFDATGFKVQNAIEDDKSQAAHHSFNDEMEVLTAVEQGDKEKVHEFLEKGFIQTFRTSSNDALTHYRNVCISSIILVSRAAIRGGVPTTMAYDFSNTLMKQVDKVPSISQMYALICSVFNRYTQMVIDEKRSEIPNNITEQCRQYVLAHYKEKITVNDIADYIGKSPNYVSHIFKEKVGVTLNHYINFEKINAAKDILKYSDLDVSTVSNFLSFSSQAYFGKIFKEMTGMTPKKYKDEHRVKELSFETALKSN